MQKSNLLFVLIFMLGLLSANIVITSNTEFSQQMGITNNYTLTIFNNNSFDIFDFTIPELEEKGFEFDNISVKSNQSNSTTFTVKTNESFAGTITARVQYKFYVDLPEEIKTYPILISQYGFNPTYITIRQGDTIQWTNEANIRHSLYSLQMGTIDIEPNETKTYQFNSLGTFSYYDLDFKIFNQFNGVVEVVNRTEQQKVHNPNYDEIWSIYLNSFSEPTIISANNSQDTFEVAHTQTKNGLLTIKNIGSNTAEKVFLSSTSDWIVFATNNFSLSTGDTKWVEYTILPFLTATNQSNLTYNIDIGVKALNSNKENLSISLFVPYKEISTSLNSDMEINLWYKNVFCPMHPCSLFCDPELPECQANKCGLNGGNSVITANMTAIDLFNTMSGISEIKNRLERSENNQKLFFDKYGMTVEQALSKSNESLAINKDIAKKQKGLTNAIMWVVFSLAVVVCVAFIGKRVNDIAKKRSYMDTGSNYRRE